MLTVICVLAVVLGVWTIRNIFVSDFDEDTLTERQRSSMHQTQAILGPWQPVGTALFVLNSANGLLLFVGGITAFRLHPWGRKQLLGALLFAVATDALGLVWLIGMYAATYRINLDSMSDSTPSVPPSYLEAGYLFGLVVICALMLLKIILEVAGCKYLRSELICQLFSSRGK
jgi:hypothetical protein